MAKSKKVKIEKVVDDYIKVTEVTEKTIEPEIKISQTIITPIKRDNEEEMPDEIEVVGIAQAEQFQKQGWQLLSVSQTSLGKTYKFKKGK